MSPCSSAPAARRSTPQPQVAAGRLCAVGRVLSTCFLLAMRGVARMPWGIQRGLGVAAGGLMYRLMRRRRRIAETNLALCFPRLDDAARTRLVRRHFRSLGLALVETALAWWGSEPRIMARSRIVGAEHLEAALARGRGVILLGGHFTTFELSGRILASQFECGATAHWSGCGRSGTERNPRLRTEPDRRSVGHTLGHTICWSWRPGRPLRSPPVRARRQASCVRRD